MNNTDDNVWKKLYHRYWGLSWFVIEPLIVYIAIIGITNSLVLAITVAIVAFVIWTIIFFAKGIYKEIL